MSFINDNFMLKNKTAKKLYKMVKDLPIIDYHCHLNPKMIAENYQFRNAFDLFLGGDHYKWRQMRTNGVTEDFITGDKDEYAKFLEFAKTLPLLIGNPLYHWTHLELKRYFGIDKTLNEDTCKEIWDKVNECLAKEEFRAQELIKRSNVEVICTTDDPADSLEYHKQLKDFPVKILPTMRPDKLMNIDQATFKPYLEQIGAKSYEDIEKFIVEKIAFFNENGCRLSDHALEYVPFAEGNPKEVFDKFPTDFMNISRGMLSVMSGVEEIIIWLNFTYDSSREVIVGEFRSREIPIVDVAYQFGGGGHTLACGASFNTWEEVDECIKAFDNLAKEKC